MYISGSAGGLTGWKAVVAAVVIVGFIGAGAWLKLQPQKLGSGTWELEPDMFQYVKMQMKQTANLQAEFQSDSGNTYAVMVVRGEDVERLASTQPDDVQPLAMAEGTGPVRLGPVQVNSGDYAIIAMTTGKDKMNVKYKITARK